MLTMIYKYTIEGESGDYIVRFPDIPEALTGGSTKEECHELARDCLIGSLDGYITMNKPIPTPTNKGKHKVALRPIEAAKVCLWNAMREKGMSRVALANMIDVDNKIVQRWLDLDHASKIEDIHKTLRLVFGLRLVTSVEKSA